jgi:single-stranded-DNA-specific exonuclease
LKIAPGQIENFRRQFVRFVAADANAPAPVDEIRIDAEVRLADINTRSVLELEQLGPFGMQNRRPILAASRVELAGPPKKMGEGERHLALTLRQYGVTIRAVAFGRAEWAEELAVAGPNFSICFQPVINRFNGQERAELQLIDWQPTPAGVRAASPV